MQGVPLEVDTQNASDTIPAVVHCNVTCQRPGSYIPAMGIIITELGIFKEAREDVLEDGLYNNITYQNIMSCTGDNDVMEFRYLVYPTSVKMDRTVLTCGVVYLTFDQTPCWGQSYLIIRYTSEYNMTTEPSCTTTVATTTMITGTIGGGDGTSLGSRVDPVVVYSPLIATLATALVIAISL